MCLNMKGFVQILLPLGIIIAALAIGIGYKLINKSATLDDPVEKEVVQVIEKEVNEIVKDEMPSKAA